MQKRPFVLLIFITSLAMVIAACATDSDDDEVVEADETVTEEVDDTSEDAADTDEEVAEESDDATEEEADETVEATEEEDDEAVEDEDDATVEDSDDATAEESDETTDDFALDEDEFDAVLVALGFDPDEEEVEAPALDVETLTAETPAMTLEARAYENVYVGEITEELLVAVSMDSTYAGDADSISAYVCDGDDVGFYVTGHVEDGQATIQLAENAVLEFTVNGESISGAVTMNEQELGSFDATEATGDAGFYVAETTVEGHDVGARWIVLDDGRQAGQMCIGVWARGVCIGIYVSRN